MRCRKFKYTVLEYIEGSIREKERAAFETHLKECASCRTHLKNLEENHRAFTTRFTDAYTDNTNDNKVLKKIVDDIKSREIEVKASFPRNILNNSFLNGRNMLAAAGSLALLVLFFTVIIKNHAGPQLVPLKFKNNSFTYISYPDKEEKTEKPAEKQYYAKIYNGTTGSIKITMH